MIDLTNWQIFCDIAETGSFSRAAERSFLTQSAVSQRLRALERALGQTLLDRKQGKSQMALTAAGQVLFEGAKRLLREAHELDAEVRGLSDEAAGTVRVATVYSVGLHALPPRLKPFLAAHPRIAVHLEYEKTGAIYQEILSGAVDVGIVAYPSPRRGIEIRPFGESPMVLICAPEHPLSSQPEIRLTELEGAAFIAFADGIPTRKLVDERLQAAGVQVGLTAAYDNIETMKNLVEIGSGVSIVPEDTVRQETRAGALVAVPLAPSDQFSRPTGLLLKEGARRRAVVRLFAAWMSHSPQE